MVWKLYPNTQAELIETLHLASRYAQDAVNEQEGRRLPLERVLAPTFVLKTPEGHSFGSNRAALLAYLRDSGDLDKLALEPSQLSVVSLSEDQAHVTGSVQIEARQGQRVYLDERRIWASLRRAAKGWEIEFIEVGARPNEQPEARP